jgi:multidrug resistance protein
VKLRDFRGPVGVLAVSMFLDFTGHTIIIPVVPFLVGRYVPATSVALMVGLIISAYALCQFAAAPLLGALSDRFGRRPILLVSLLGSIVGYVIFGLGGALWVLFAGRIIDGLTGGNISTLFAYVADVTEPSKRGRTYGLLGAAGGFGFIVGPVLGGLFGHFSLSAPVFIAALLTSANVAWASFALPESLPREKRAAFPFCGLYSVRHFFFTWPERCSRATFRSSLRIFSGLVPVESAFFFSSWASWTSRARGFSRENCCPGSANRYSPGSGSASMPAAFS